MLFRTKGASLARLIPKKLTLLNKEESRWSKLTNAYRGADGVFVLTDFYRKMSFDNEVEQGVNQIDAAREAGVRHVVLSTLEGVEKVVGERMKKVGGHAVAHFDSKDKITDYAKDSGLNVTYLYTSFYVSAAYRDHKAQSNKCLCYGSMTTSRK
jgi:hypothetical protein